MTWGSHCPQCGREDCNWVRGTECEGGLLAEIERLEADNRSYETTLARKADEIERLRAELATRGDAAFREWSFQNAKITEAAAFLDVLAHHITRWPAVGNHLKEQQRAAAECRAMAARLRGEDPPLPHPMDCSCSKCW